MKTMKYSILSLSQLVFTVALSASMLTASMHRALIHITSRQ